MRKADDIRETGDWLRYVQLPTRQVFLWNALNDAKLAWTPLRRHVRRAFKLVTEKDAEMRLYDLERLEWFIDELEAWTAAIREEIDKRRGNLGKRKRIELLRAKAESTTFEGEARVFFDKADRLEKELDA